MMIWVRDVRLWGVVSVLMIASCISCDAASAGAMPGHRKAFGTGAVPRALSRTLHLRGGSGTDIPPGTGASPALASKGAVHLSPVGTSAVPLVKPFGRIQRTNSYSSLNEVELTGDKAGKISEDDALNTIHKLDLEIKKLATEVIPKSGTLPDGERLNIVVISSEISPFSKSGGLADVANKLSSALSRIGHRVMTVAPMYKKYDGIEATGVKRTFGLFDTDHTVEYSHGWEDTGKDKGVDHLFVKHPCFERPGMYGEEGLDYGDNLFRMALFAWAALEAPLVVPCGGVPYGEDIVFVANDWQAGFVPLILTSHYRRYKVYGKARCIFDIHNMGYQGPFPNPPSSEAPPFSFCDFGLRDNAYYDKYFWVYPEKDRAHGLDKGEAVKLLKGAIEMCDRVVTVAPSYAEEIMTTEGAWGMEEITKRRFEHTSGILNGIDTVEWDPMHDAYLEPLGATWNATHLAGKAKAKQLLQQELGLQQRPDVPIVAFIGRLAPQKGVDLIEEIFPWLMERDQTGVTGDVQVVMMGSGEARYADFLRRAENQNKGKVAGYVGFKQDMEHKIIAGADILLMPSRYEPCGLPQMYAQRYGTIPVVHACGGLKDSVTQVLELRLTNSISKELTH